MEKTSYINGTSRNRGCCKYEVKPTPYFSEQKTDEDIMKKDWEKELASYMERDEILKVGLLIRRVRMEFTVITVHLQLRCLK